jgi:hypothetical protein
MQAEMQAASLSGNGSSRQVMNLQVVGTCTDRFNSTALLTLLLKIEVQKTPKMKLHSRAPLQKLRDQYKGSSRAPRNRIVEEMRDTADPPI